MTEQTVIRVEVAYATPERQRIVELTMPPGTGAREAALRSGLDAEFPGLDLHSCALGIFSRRVADDAVLRAGDRVELYRPLPNEPREARRRRAAGLR